MAGKRAIPGDAQGCRRGCRRGRRWGVGATSRISAATGAVIASAAPPILPPPIAESTMPERDLVPLLHRIADALERLAPTGPGAVDFTAADAFVWHADREWLEPVPTVNRVPIRLLRGIDRVRDI